MKKIKIFPLILIMCLAVCALAPSAYAVDDPQLTAKAVLLADLNSGEVLYELNADEQRSPASLTKIMTGLLAVEAIESGQCRMDDIITVGADAWQGLGEDASNSNIQPGEMMTYKDVLYCALMHSANEACNVLATYISGSISAFVDRMNERAAELGAVNTHFLDTNGLSNDGHYTTARDLYIITKEAVSHPDFLSICDCDYYKTQPTNMNEAREFYNSNALISNGGYYAAMSMQNNGHDYLYEGASGVKTGYTRAAGYCLISTAQRGDVRLLAVVLGCGGELNTQEMEFGNFTNTIDLYDWCFDNFSYRTLVSASQFSEKVTARLAEGDGTVLLRPTEDVRALLPNDVDDASITTEVKVFDEKLVAPIEAGTVLGEVHIVADGVDYGSVKLVNPNAVELSKSELIKTQLKAFFSKGWVVTLIIVVLVLAGVYLVLVARYRALRRRHLAERRRIEAERRRAYQQRELERQREYERQQRYAERARQTYDAPEDDYDPYADRYVVDEDGYDEPEYDDGTAGEYYAEDENGECYEGEYYDDGYGGYGEEYDEGEEYYDEPRTNPADLDELFNRYDDNY